MLKGDDGTYTALSISVIWGFLPEYGKREMWSLPRTRIFTGLPHIPFTHPVEAKNDDNIFGSLTMSLFVPL